MRYEPETGINRGVALALLLIRVALAAVFMAHGAQKLFGAFGGPGIGGTAGFLGKMGVHPAIVFAWVVAIVEFFGGLAVLLGFLTRLAALGIAVDMIVAIAMVHGKNGFFLQNGGFEYAMSMLLMAAALICSGAGPYSVDRLIHWKY